MISTVTVVFAVISVCLAMALAVITVIFVRMRNKPQPPQRFDTRYAQILDWEVEEKIRLSKKQLETTFDAMADLICVIDSGFRIARVNKSYADKTGRSVKDLPGEKCFTAFLGRKEECDDCPAHRTLREGVASKKDVVIKRVGDEERLFEISTFPVTDRKNQVINVIEHIRDVTQERLMNEQLIRAEKLAGIGIMTSGIAHEMNNPLSGISGTAVNLLKTPEKYGLNEKGADRVSIILECAARATMIMKDLLRFSQKQEMVRIPIDLSVLVPRAVAGVRPPGSSRITRTYDIPANLPRVCCDPAKIEQVIANITTNAVQAILERRRELYDGKPQPDESIHISARRCGDDVCVEFQDNGIGIPANMESKIFDPFFTTKAPGEGAGLCLSICHRIIEEHQGSINASTSNGRTMISVVLPVGADPWKNSCKEVGGEGVTGDDV